MICLLEIDNKKADGRIFRVLYQFAPQPFANWFIIQINIRNNLLQIIAIIIIMNKQQMAKNTKRRRKKKKKTKYFSKLTVIITIYGYGQYLILTHAYLIEWIIYLHKLLIYAFIFLNSNHN